MRHIPSWLVGIVFVAATFLIYQQVWTAGFIWDDDARLTKNPCIVASSPYHLVNILVHAANGILLWRVVRVFHIPGALLGAAHWTAHPVQVQSSRGLPN